jgi:glucose-6-phosphate dehydrogenase-like protein
LKKTQLEEESPYERLLTDAMHGDKLLFVREDVVEAARSIVDPILNNVVPLRTYNPERGGLKKWIASLPMSADGPPRHPKSAYTRKLKKPALGGLQPIQTADLSSNVRRAKEDQFDFRHQG